MDELELLKKDWKKQDVGFIKKTSNELYDMLQKKSSSIVKTLFFISVAELVFWITLNLVPLFASREFKQELNEIYQKHEFALTALTVISILIIVSFTFILYSSYKSISVTDNAKLLMEKILKTRKVVKYYVLCNLALIAINFIFSMNYAITENAELSARLNLATSKETLIFTLKIIVIFGVFLTIFWLFYRLIYGILVKRLNNNYNELKKLEE